MIIRQSHIIIKLQILVALRYLAKGDFFSEVAYFYGISEASVSRIIPRACEAICRSLDNINFPRNIQRLRRIKQDFHAIARFPNIVGAIDGTLIPIQGMSTPDEPSYVCRKQFHALNIMAITDAELR